MPRALRFSTALTSATLLVACRGDGPAFDGASWTGQSPLAAPISGAVMVDVFYGAYRDVGGVEPRDYTCGDKTYPAHAGVDVLIRDFPVQDSGVAVVAAAGGVVAAVVDEHPDRNTALGDPAGFGNNVILRHGRELESIYAHLRLGSVTVTPGEHVGRGDVLGLVGSSGNSNWPHLHFEVRRGGSVVEPFAGACGAVASLWETQLPYQNTFSVTGAGSIADQTVTPATLLERPANLTRFPVNAERFLFWIQLANQPAASMRIEVHGPGGSPAHTILGDVGPSFSMRYLLASVAVGGVLTEPGAWELRVFQNGEPIWTHAFMLEPAPAPAARDDRTDPPIAIRAFDQAPGE